MNGVPRFCFSPFCADTTESRAGKVRGNVLPPEYELSRFIANITGRHKTWTTEKSVTEWAGVHCANPATITAVRWGGRDLYGTLDWAYLPSTITYLHLGIALKGCLLAKNYLEGRIETSLLPRGLQEFSSPRTRFSGEFDLTQLPPALCSLNVSGNQLSGSLDFTRLPDGLTRLCLSENRFSGTVTFAHLPTSMSVLRVDEAGLIVDGSVPKSVQLTRGAVYR
eukprot:CAMPEP_0201484402 /NCGR_PEP_ID=MMETSP0151_2-20130828/8600_1 /ASSEMBLY_ACC=CAM_ASM_000257 /TAXON_ID=200890 /ORGANISM="Paramoeba atlantica, Strain 621/1 / CCAP 1560/9" /LENGTH=222 /DNA_ID=CAMNT_0047868069 /DNA_START=29 /DNA_END=697 /DNA_ORIENTATION=+